MEQGGNSPEHNAARPQANHARRLLWHLRADHTERPGGADTQGVFILDPETNDGPVLRGDATENAAAERTTAQVCQGLLRENSAWHNRLVPMPSFLPI